MSNTDLVRLTALTHPFKAERQDLALPEGLTVDQMLDIAQPDRIQLEHALVFIKGELIPREAWSVYRPTRGTLVEVRAFPIPRGGGGDGGKSPLRIILTIAVIAFAMWAGPIVARWAFGMGPLTQAATNALNMLSALSTGVIAGAGLLAINAIAPVRASQLEDLSSNSSSDSPTLFITGARNALRPFTPLPVLLGKHRIYPSLGAKPYTEIIGDKQFVRMLFVWGVGPVEFDADQFKIGETLLSSFEGVKVEHREGYADDEPLTLFPSVVDQQDFSVLLTQAVGWVERTSEADADELSVDITFASGLVAFDDRGNRGSRSVVVEIEYKLVGASPDEWQKIDTSNAKFETTVDASWMSKTGNDLNSITFTHNRTSAIRHGIRWGVPARGQYMIRVRRTTADVSSTQIFDQSSWTALRTITDEDPVNSPVPVAKTALVIQATDQLNGIVEEFNGVATTVCLDWDSGSPSWVLRATQNPASLFRHVLQGNGMAVPLADARIDLDTLADWHEFCIEKGFKFNMNRDFKASVWDTLADIAGAGRAAPTQIDGKWSVVIEREQENPVSHITPRNSFDFKAQKFFVDMPHAWRVQFVNEDGGHQFDERIIYRDGYTAANATKFESLEFPGVTDPDQVYKLGRFRMAQIINQPERWSVKQDMEYLTYRRGSRVALTHDVLLVGQASGRIKTVVLSGADVTGVTIDETVTMEEGQEYGISIRTLSGQKTAQVVTVAGSTNVLTFTAPIAGEGSPAAAVVRAGDVFGFGLLGQETEDASIISIVPDANFRAQAILVPYRASTFTADTEEVPAFESRITPLVSIPAPSIKTVLSDESALAIGQNDTVRARISIAFDQLDREIFGDEPQLRVQVRPSGTLEPWTYANYEQDAPGHIFINDVKTGETWDIRIRFVVPKRLPGPWTTISGHLVVGKSTPPGPLTNMTISVFGAQALIRWDRPAEMDVLFGGEVVFRHTQEIDNPSWPESVTIGQAARARTLYAVLPLKAGTYMARVYDVDGNPSNEITYVSTKQASVHQFASVDTVDEAPAWLGDKTDTVEDSGNLLIDDGLSPQEALEGTYNFAQGVDLGSVQRVRLTTRISVGIYNVNDTIGSRLDNISKWESFSGALAAGADAQVFVRHTDDDPAGSPVNWSDWERLDSAEFEARAFEWYVKLTRESIDYNIRVSELGVDIEAVA